MKNTTVENNLTEANLLNQEIKDLKYFIMTLDVPDLWREKSNVTALVEKVVEQKTTYKIFGRRFFGCGAHERLIDIPTSMIPSIVTHAKELLKKKKTDLTNLFNKP